MLARAPLVVFALLLASCGTVENTKTGVITVRDENYELRTRTIDGPQGTYEHTSVNVRGIYFPCKIDSPGDCEGAVHQGLERVDRF